ncbi:flagellar hook-basal body protein FliE [Paramesorhizobium deserti]|uniref:Flagellar hook-basal body complex protein FliE n=1 Tax=Paramesorhizobium deserti TaxID=1494590 RepID=A0A135HS58_9HYPH|nr:flagellar hook-basal body complex protein FliE [Paramesorhizobium deserti]KXF76025.1 flagellar hook-basal body protein FliE [Paramesorhizobium deserti]
MIDSLLSVSTRNALSKLSESVSEAGAVGAAIAPVNPSAANQPSVGEASFGDVLSQLTGSVGDKLKNAEAMSISSMTGDVPTREVVSSVMEAEQSLQTAIAIRDKIVQAYLEISRMQI